MVIHKQTRYTETVKIVIMKKILYYKGRLTSMQTIRNVRDNYQEPITSREDRAKMSIQNKTSYNKWVQKLQRETKPKSPRDFQKVKAPVLFNKPEIRITSKEQKMGNSNIRKPKALTVDHEVYTAICSRKPTCPVLATSPRQILLPPPREDKWSYTTTKF